MKKTNWISAALTAITAAILPACDIIVLPEIKPGITTGVEVRAKMGNPGFEFRNEDGTVTWEYTRQPAGVHCYMITLGADQRVVQKLKQVLNDSNYAKAREGNPSPDSPPSREACQQDGLRQPARGSLGVAYRGHTGQRNHLVQCLLRYGISGQIRYLANIKRLLFH